MALILFLAMLAGSAPGQNPAYLVRFGGPEEVDWSGSVSGAPCRLSGWQFDGDDAVSGQSWKCATRRQRYWDTPYERALRPTSTREKVTWKGVVIEVNGDHEIRIATRQGDFTFRTNLAIGDAPLKFLDGRVTVAAVPRAYYATQDAAAEDYPSLCEAKDGTLWLAYQSYEGGGDQVYVQRLAGSAWSEPEPLARAGGDYFRTAIAQDGAGRIWVVWAAQVDSNFDLYARAFDGRRWSPEERLTTAPNSDIFHVLAADAAGHLYLAYQSARAGNFDIYLRIFDGRSWSKEIQVSSDPANDWEPALAVDRNGRVAVLWDTYAGGNYNVAGRIYENGKLGSRFTVATSGALENRVTAQYDRRGRLWMAWDEGDFNWGKDYGYQLGELGRGLMVRRQVRVAVLENGRLLETPRTLAESVDEDLSQAFQHPTLALDANDNPWVFFRTRINLPQSKDRGAFRALWRLGGATYRGGRWSAVEFPEGFGRMDMPAAAVRWRGGTLALVWASDGRVWPRGRPLQQDLRFALIPAGGAQEIAGLRAFRPPAEEGTPPHPHEAADIARVRADRASAGGRTLRIVRGDIHRHTDLSWDGNRDGSLDDSYRYALDAAAFDFLGVCDHQAGESIPYNWWRIQKAADLYTIAGRFAPLYSYERSLNYPNGHRNVFFGARGRPILEIGEGEARGQEGAGQLYAYLRKFGGVTSSHTSATGMGTDWRDSDAELEPVVEIYQGYRSNYETLGAPRAPTAKESAKFAAGFIWNAWAKGIKLGVQSSSDHVSTHVSYAGFYVDRVSREAILAAMKARHAYAATDNLLVDVRMGEHFMGDAFKSESPAPLEVHVAGTGPIDRVEVIKSNRIVYSAPGAGAEMRFTYNDREGGQAYYYVRVVQQDGQLGWSSPMWVE